MTDLIQKGDIICVYGGTLWQIFGPFIRLGSWIITLAFLRGGKFPDSFHIELGEKDMKEMEDYYTALSRQPPVTKIVKRFLKDVKIRVYRLIQKPLGFDEAFDQWKEKQLGDPYGFTGFCGHMVAEFYELIKVPCTTNHPLTSYPGNIENFITKSTRYQRIHIGFPKARRWTLFLRFPPRR